MTEKIACPPIRTALQKYIIRRAAGDFFTRQGGRPKEYFVYFEGFQTKHWGKRSADPAMRCFKTLSQQKRERGEQFFAPHRLPFCMAYACRFHKPQLCSGRQNLAALGTAAGENLTAVGSSHSLPETVNLGTVAAAGLVGTLHVVHLLESQYARQPEIRPQRHLVNAHNGSC